GGLLGTGFLKIQVFLEGCGAKLVLKASGTKESIQL
ncbi:rCG42693, partial [Rattus norvegicus]